MGHASKERVLLIGTDQEGALFGKSARLFYRATQRDHIAAIWRVLGSPTSVAQIFGATIPPLASSSKIASRAPARAAPTEAAPAGAAAGRTARPKNNPERNWRSGREY
jgi:hypothetical protein